MVQWSAQGSGDALHNGDAGKTDQCSGHPVQRDEVCRVPHVVIRLDHQQLEQFALREVSVRRRETLIGRGASLKKTFGGWLRIWR